MNLPKFLVRLDVSKEELSHVQNARDWTYIMLQPFEPNSNNMEESDQEEMQILDQSSPAHNTPPEQPVDQDFTMNLFENIELDLMDPNPFDIEIPTTPRTSIRNYVTNYKIQVEIKATDISFVQEFIDSIILGIFNTFIKPKKVPAKVAVIWNTLSKTLPDTINCRFVKDSNEITISMEIPNKSIEFKFDSCYYPIAKVIIVLFNFDLYLRIGFNESTEQQCEFLYNSNFEFESCLKTLINVQKPPWELYLMDLKVDESKRTFSDFETISSFLDSVNVEIFKILNNPKFKNDKLTRKLLKTFIREISNSTDVSVQIQQDFHQISITCNGIGDPIQYKIPKSHEILYRLIFLINNPEMYQKCFQNEENILNPIELLNKWTTEF